MRPIPTHRSTAVLLSLVTLLTSAVTATATNCTYASQAYITQVFSNLVSGNLSAFFAHVVDDVDWNVQGTHPLAGRYGNKTLFVVNAVERLAQSQNLNFPDQISFVQVVGGCDEEWSVEELREEATTQNGRVFDNTYAWVTRWSTQKQIVQVRAYLDSALVARTIYENEFPTNSTYHTPKTVLEPGPGGLQDITGVVGPG